MLVSHEVNSNYSGNKWKKFIFSLGDVMGYEEE